MEWFANFKVVNYQQPIVWATCNVWYVDGLQLDWNPEKKGTVQVTVFVPLELNLRSLKLLVLQIEKQC